MNQNLDLFGDMPTRPLSIPLPAGRSARERKANGQYRAAKKAGSLWMELALDKLKLFLAAKKAGTSNAEFTFEEFRAMSEAEAWPLPASVNAWGTLPAAARRAGLCRFTGRATEAKRPESHARLIKVWQAL